MRSSSARGLRTGPEGRSQTQAMELGVLSDRHCQHQPHPSLDSLPGTGAHTVARTRHTGKMTFEGGVGEQGWIVWKKGIFQPIDPIGHVAARVSTDTRPTGGTCKGRFRRKKHLLCWHLLSFMKICVYLWILAQGEKGEETETRQQCSSQDEIKSATTSTHYFPVWLLSSNTLLLS